MTESKRAILIGLIGTGIQQSLAPELHMQEGERSGLRYIYRLIDLTRLGLGIGAVPGLLDAAERTGFDGLAVTHSCKEAVIPYLSELSDDARRVGAVNTILFNQGRRVGHNTDWVGFAESFRHDMAGAKTDRVVQLGAGGAGKAVAHALLSCGVTHLAILDLDLAKAQSVVDGCAARHGRDRISTVRNLAEEVAAADGIVNATPIGMAAHPGTPLPVSLLRPDLWVADVIYSPEQTELLRAARSMGARITNGTGMLLFQAIEQFRLFTGIEPDAARMRDHLAQLRTGR
jgi:shikimate dehydrogenase